MMRDGDAHPAAIEETKRLFQRDDGGGEFRRAIGSLVFKRHATLDNKCFDDAYERHELVSGRAFYSVNLVEQHKGLVAVFDYHDDTLRLLAVVPIENFIYEMKTGGALSEGLRLALQRWNTQ